MAGRSLRGLIVVAAMLALAAPAHAGLSVLDNSTIRLGVDLSQGGKLTWLSRSQGEHTDNMLFEAEQSYYGGGDWHAYQDPAVVIDHTNDGRTLYVRAFDTSCECTMDTWITLHGSAAVVRNRLTNFRIDTTRYQPGNAELPALYTTGLLYRIVTYDGLEPFTHAPVDDLTDRARGAFFVPGAYNTDATEHWVAAVDDAHFGVGLVEPSVTQFVALSGNPDGYPSAYIAGTRSELWDANVVYDYTYTLVVGSLTQIRTYAYAHRPDPRPSYVFAHDRQHFIEYRTTDAGFPIHGALRVPLDQGGAVLEGPRQLWPASRVPHIYVRGAWHSQQSVAAAWWYDPAGNVFERPFRVVPDGAFRTYRVDFFRSPGYTGMIAGLRLEPGIDRELGAWADITCISWKPCPIDRAAERALEADHGVPFLDSFDTLNTAFWSLTGNSPQVTPAVTGGALVIDVPANAQPLPAQDYVSAGLYSRCRIGGNYDVQVDYRLLTWPDANGVNLNFNVGDKTIFRHNGSGGELVSTYFPPLPGTNVLDYPLGGELRFERKGALLTALYRDRLGSWVVLNRVGVDDGPVNVNLSIYTNRPTTGAADVKVAFDNFRVTGGEIDCP